MAGNASYPAIKEKLMIAVTGGHEFRYNRELN
jgi:hypothetical protein